jgi:hypothetical protein
MTKKYLTPSELNARLAETRDQKFRKQSQAILDKHSMMSAYMKQQWKNSDYRKKTKTKLKESIREYQGTEPEIIKKIFHGYYDTDRNLNTREYKAMVRKKYNLSGGYVHKIISANSDYIKDILKLDAKQIAQIKKMQKSDKVIFEIVSFGVDRMEYYKDYSFRSKFSIEQIWQCRFGKFKGLTRKPLEENLGMSLSQDDANSLRKLSCKWLTDKPSKVLHKGNRTEILKYVAVTPTKNEKFTFVHTGKYEGCMIVREDY